jgi:hypothetical protein
MTGEDDPASIYGMSRRSLLQANTSLITGTVIINVVGSSDARCFGAEPTNSSARYP